MTGITQHRRCVLRELGQRFAARSERRADIGGVAGELRCLRCAKLLTRGEQAIERLPVAPVELIGDPGRDRRLREALHLLGLFRRAVLLQFSHERVARTGELAERQLEQAVDLVAYGLVARPLASRRSLLATSLSRPEQLSHSLRTPFCRCRCVSHSRILLPKARSCDRWCGYAFSSFLSSLRKRQSVPRAISLLGFVLIIPTSCSRSAWKRRVSSGSSGNPASAGRP